MIKLEPRFPLCPLPFPGHWSHICIVLKKRHTHTHTHTHTQETLTYISSLTIYPENAREHISNQSLFSTVSARTHLTSTPPPSVNRLPVGASVTVWSLASNVHSTRTVLSDSCMMVGCCWITTWFTYRPRPCTEVRRRSHIEVKYTHRGQKVVKHEGNSDQRPTAVKQGSHINTYTSELAPVRMQLPGYST